MRTLEWHGIPTERCGAGAPFRWTWRTDRSQNRRDAPAESHHATQVATLLQQYGAKLYARTYGSTVIVESGPAADPVKHLRPRRDTVHLWRLDIARHTGRWEATPFRTQLPEFVELVVASFPCTLAPIG